MATKTTALAALTIAAALAASAAAAAGGNDRLVNRGVLPDGHPAMIVAGAETTDFDVPRRQLQFAVIDGRRVLIDPDTRAVVYTLRP